MLLVSIEGMRLDIPGAPDGRTIMSTRINEYAQSTDAKLATRLQSFRTWQWLQVTFRQMLARNSIHHTLEKFSNVGSTVALQI